MSIILEVLEDIQIWSNKFTTFIDDVETLLTENRIFKLFIFKCLNLKSFC